jgi:hypothetical protein
MDFVFEEGYEEYGIRRSKWTVNESEIQTKYVIVIVIVVS